MAAIGVGGQGTGIMKWAKSKPGVKFVAVCDLDADHRKKAAKVVGKDCHEYNDFRELLAKEKLDAVTIGTVDHWHALTVDRRDEGRLRRLLREAAVADDRGRQGDGQGGPEVRPRLPDRQPAALRRPLSPGLRAGAQRPDRQGAHRRGPDRRQPDRRPVPRRRPSPKGSTGTSGKAPRPTSRTSRNDAITSSAGGTNTPAAR